MTTLVLIRHGQTAWNTAGRFRGRADIGLDATGFKQVEALNAYLKDVPLESVYSSPLKRALQTAASLAEAHGLKVTTAPELTDLDYGLWQGMKHTEAAKLYSELYDLWHEKPHLAQIPGGETLDIVRERAMRCVERIVKGPDTTAALVSHRAVNRLLVCAMLGLDDSHFMNISFDTCGVTFFKYKKGGFTLASHNDTSFLRRPGAAVEEA